MTVSSLVWEILYFERQSHYWKLYILLLTLIGLFYDSAQLFSELTTWNIME